MVTSFLCGRLTLTPNAQPNVVALTFDDGPYIYQPRAYMPFEPRMLMLIYTANVPELVQTLQDAGIKGTFFV
jgi:peptidoglycan/xylan/chitin deacetylase (PgdA/CDA1 family)